MCGLKEGSCFPGVLVGVNVGLACFDGIIAILAFTQLVRIHSQNSQLGWTRQKVFHLLIGSSNVVLIFANWLPYLFCFNSCCCLQWMAMLVVLLWFCCHGIPQISVVFSISSTSVILADDEEEEDEGYGFLEALLKRSLYKSSSSNPDSDRICSPCQSIHVGSRQKIVILVTVLIFVLMMTFALVIWIGMGDNPIDSSLMARVYVSLFAIAILLLGGALACYGLLLCLKMRTVRSERASSEMWKIAGLAIVSVVCFTSSAFIALLTEIPVLYHRNPMEINIIYTSSLLILYYFVGSSVPSACVLWVMRDLPPLVVDSRQDEAATIAFIHDSSAASHHPQCWTTATSAQSQVQVPPFLQAH